MELRLLRYVVQVAAERNFSRAAAKLHITQPSLSQQIAKLERELGVVLFHRSPGAVEPTHAGRVFVERAREILDLADLLAKEMDDLAHMRKGRLVVGSLPMTGAHLLPLVLPVFRGRHPEVDISLVEDTTLRLEERTAAGEVDVAFLTLPLTNAGLEGEPVVEDEIWLAVSPDHPLAARSVTAAPGRVDVAELAREPFILLKQGQGFRNIAIQLCRNAGFEPRIAFESGNIETVQSLVAAGMGVAFVPSMVARNRSGRFAPMFVELSGRPTRTIVLARRRDRFLSKAAEAFRDTVFDVLKHVPGGLPSDLSEDGGNRQ